MIYAGIDCGLDGFVAKLLPGGGIAFHPCPTMVWKKKKRFDPNAMANIFRDAEPSFYVIEKQWARPGEGATTACTSCQGYGLWIGMLVALEIPYVAVPPVAWQRVMHARADGGLLPGKPKERTLAAAAAMFPEVDLRRTPRCRTLCHDKADALLLAAYGRKMHEIT